MCEANKNGQCTSYKFWAKVLKPCPFNSDNKECEKVYWATNGNNKEKWSAWKENFDRHILKVLRRSF